MADSFSFDPSTGSLTEHGPYGGHAYVASEAGVDITADGKYALIGEQGNYGYIMIGLASINSDGSLGSIVGYGGYGSLGHGADTGWLWLSPDERFVFVTGNVSVTTLHFNEATQSLTYSGCIVRLPNFNFSNGLTTTLPTGAGGALAVTEVNINKGAVGLFRINPTTGCLGPVAGSPYHQQRSSDVSSIVSWPPRPF